MFARAGDRLRLRYSKRYTWLVNMSYQDATGVVVIRVKGPGPINLLIALDNGRRVVAPRGNVRRER